MTQMTRIPEQTANAETKSSGSLETRAVQPSTSSAGTRLNAWYALIFTLGVGGLFALAYLLVARVIENADHAILESKLGEYAAIYQVGGFRALEQAVRRDDESGQQKSLFVRLADGRNAVTLAKVPDEWITFQNAETSLNGFRRQIGTIHIPRDAERDFAITSAVLPDGALLQVGRSTTNRDRILRPFRQTFLIVGGAVILLGLATGRWLAHRTLRPVREVVATARRIIATGDHDARVPERAGVDELTEMAALFNNVLEKNASLVRAMRESLDNTAHDLRTPLTRLRGLAELALQNDDPAAHREALADCAEESERVLAMLRALMDVTEAEAGMMRLDRGPADLAQLIAEAVELYAMIAEEKGIVVTSEVVGPIVAPVDPARIRQVFANLLDNALKYTPSGGSVAISALREKGTITVTFRDNGIGIAPDEQTRIWSRLYRSDRSRTQRGLGLGLSLVKAIVEAHGGSVAVRSGLGAGSEFTVTLPSSGAEPV
jgi:signal transduction histidine kinase